MGDLVGDIPQSILSHYLWSSLKSTLVIGRLLLNTVNRKRACHLSIENCPLVSSALGQKIPTDARPATQNPLLQLILPVHWWVWVGCLGCFVVIFVLF